MVIDTASSEFRFLVSRMEQGDVILFCGAGFSADCRNRYGSSPPLGSSLAQKLAEMAQFAFDGEPLPVVYNAARRRLGTQPLNTTLRDLYTITECDDWYSIVTSFVWHRIHTVNIDNLLEHIYSKQSSQRLDTIVCPDSYRDRDPHFADLQSIHLHGSVNDLGKGVTFTLDEFADQQTAQNRWYEALIDDVFWHPVVFVGSLMEESPFHHYVALRGQKHRGKREYRPKSFLVCPQIGEIRAEALREQNILAVESTAREFFEALSGYFADSPITIEGVRRRVFPHIFVAGSPRDESILAHFDPIRSDNLPPTPRILDNSFFLGAEPTWKDIEEGRDGKRVVTDAILDEADRHDGHFQCLVVHGPAGCGKTTILKRLAYELAARGDVVFFSRNERNLDLDGLIRLANDPNYQASRLFVLVDTVGRYSRAIHRVREVLSTAERMTLIVAERSNVYAAHENAFEKLAPVKLPVRNLTQEEVESILERLEGFSYLGALRDKTHEERISEFMIRASRQLLVAMREATSGKGFDIILKDEYQELVPDAKLAYTICCLAVAQGAPGVYRRHLLPSLGKTDCQKGSIIAEMLCGVLVPANEAGTLLKPRHRIIAHEVSKSIAPIGIKVEALTRYLKQIAPDINRISVKSRSPVFLAYRSLINSNGLHDLLGGDSEVILGLYEELRDPYRDQFLFWLQYAMAHIDRGDLDVAENYLNQASAICEEVRGNPFQIRHQQGILYLLQACQRQTASLGRERAEDGIKILQGLIRERGDTDAYPYTGYMDYVTRWYIAAGDLVSNEEWDDLKKIAQLAAKKYPMEDMVLDGRNKVERAYLMRVATDRKVANELSGHSD